MRLIDADAFKEYLEQGTELALKEAMLAGILTKKVEKEIDETLKGILADINEQPTVNEWIMCFEKLPSTFEKVRACDADGNIEEGFIEKVGKHVICKMGDHICLDYVVAWMPLPKLYREEVEK